MPLDNISTWKAFFLKENFTLQQQIELLTVQQQIELLTVAIPDLTRITETKFTEPDRVIQNINFSELDDEIVMKLCKATGVLMENQLIEAPTVELLESGKQEEYDRAAQTIIDESIKKGLNKKPEVRDAIANFVNLFNKWLKSWKGILDFKPVIDDTTLLRKQLETQKMDDNIKKQEQATNENDNAPSGLKNN